MKLKQLIAALLSASCLISASVLPVYAQEPAEEIENALEPPEEQEIYPTLPEYISIKDLAPQNINKGRYLAADSSSVYLRSIYQKIDTDSNGYFRVAALTETEKSELEAAANEIISKVNPSWSDLAKVLFVHDYLAATRCYDTTYTKYSAYHNLVEGTSVCQGYSEAFWYLMYKLGIDCKVVDSNTLNHAWNIVKVNGNWYQIDLTWDDPIPDVPGRSTHGYFLLSDSQFCSVNSGNHNASDFQLQYEGGSAFGYCTDTTFDQGWFWDGWRYPVIISDDGYFYNIQNAYITETDSQNNSRQIMKLSEKWYTVYSENSYYTQCYSGLGLNGNTLYYNDDRNVYSCSLDGSNVKTIYSLTPEELASYRIYGLSYKDGYITLSLAESPYVSTQATKTIPATIPAVSVTPITRGAYISWEAISGASMYWLYVFDDSGIAYQTGVNGTSYCVSGLTPGKNYGFLVISCINGNWAFNDWTGDDIVYATIPYSKTIPNVSVNPTASGADVSWEAISGADMYWLYVYDDSGIAYQTGVNGTSYCVSGLTPGKQYGFLVISCINGYWAFSDWTGDDIVYATIPYGKTIPNVSVNPTASGADVSWETISGADMYWLYVFGDSGIAFQTGVNGTSYSVSGLTPGKNYGFLVISCINGNWAFGDWTGDDIVYATIPSGKTIPAVSVSPTAGSAYVSWEAISGADMYWLYVYGDSGIAFQTGVNGTSYFVSGLTGGKNYGFLVISYINGNWAFNDWTGDDIVYATVQ